MPETCVGCRQADGPPGALCPRCGSTLPNPNARMGGLVILLIGAVIATPYFVFDAPIWLALVGILVAAFGAVLIREGFGRVNHPRSR